MPRKGSSKGLHGTSVRAAERITGEKFCKAGNHFVKSTLFTKNPRRCDLCSARVEAAMKRRSR